MSFQNKTVFITGASRGIGKAIALRLAKEGANIVIAAKSTEENPKLGGTIFSAAAEIEAIGGKALAVQTDSRFEEQIQSAVELAVEKFGGIDIVINNASAIQLTGTEQTEAKRFDLMQSINIRGTFLVVKNCAPYLKKGDIIFFDEFVVPTHEFKAYSDFIQSYYINLELIAAANNYYFVAFKVA